MSHQVLSQEVRLDRFEEWLIRRKAEQLASKAGFTMNDAEDIEQDLRLNVLQRLSGFDQGQSSRHTFVAMVVRCRAATILEHQRTAKRNGGGWLLSLDVLVPGEDDDGEVEFHETLGSDVRRPIDRDDQERSDLAADVAHVVASLPDDLRKWCAVLAERNVSDAAREFGVSRVRVYQIKAQICAAFKRAGLEGYLQKK